MYTGSGFSDWEIGDITVIFHQDTYHLFHLIIPNHDYIAHAVSKDGISWKRTKNALFVGDPGSWDDDMLWTMDVVKRGDTFCMFYTGLKRQDKGRVSRIGMAVSKDLIHWQKIDAPPFPISPKGAYYESEDNNPRGWLSFRDPYYLKHNNDDYLLVCTRAAQGPVSRRGCVGLIALHQTIAELKEPLLTPMVYDDVECPCYFELNGTHYLVGSIREDIKIRYWYSLNFEGPYQSFHADVLMPQGNYAARIVKDGSHLLVYNFFFLHGNVSSLRVLPPPKEIDTDERGRLMLRSFYKWNEMADELPDFQPSPVEPLLKNPTAGFEATNGELMLSCKSGYEIFALEKPCADFIWEGQITCNGLGKFGIVCDMDNSANGYFISFDIAHGLAQIRAWGFNPENNKSNFIFNNLQANVFSVRSEKSLQFKLIRFGHYIELSIDTIVKLTLVDYTYSGRLLGFYTAGATMTIMNQVFKSLPAPADEYGSQEGASLSIPEGI